MKQIVCITYLCLCLILPSYAEQVSFDFYGNDISIEYDKALAKTNNACLVKKCFKKYAKNTEKKEYKPFIEQIESLQKRLELSDWHLFQLVDMTAKNMMPEEPLFKQNFLTWFVLNKLGYDVRLMFFHSESLLMLYAKTDEKMGAAPRYTFGGVQYTNLTAINEGIETKKYKLLSQPSYVMNSRGRAFKFQVKGLPKSEKTETVNFEFKWHDEPMKLSADVNKSLLTGLAKYPELPEMGYLNTPLGQDIQQSLIPQLKELIKGKTEQEALEILLSFVRQSFKYKSDWDIYDNDKPMFGDEVLIAEYVDHEDKCALFYNLVKETLGLEMIVMTHFNNDMTIGVLTDVEVAKPFEYEGKSYVICDPKGPTSSSKLGEWPNGLTKRTFTVLE